MQFALMMTILVVGLVATPCCAAPQHGLPFLPVPQPGFASGSGGGNLVQAQGNGGGFQGVSATAHGLVIGPGSSSSSGGAFGTQSSSPFGLQQTGSTFGTSNQQSFPGRRK